LPRSCGEIFSLPPAGPGLSPSLRAGGRPCSGGGGDGRKEGGGGAVTPGAPAGLAVAPGNGGRPPGLPLPRSNGEGDRPAGPGGACVTPGRGRPPGVGFPRSNGAGEPRVIVAVAPGSTRPALPRGPGDNIGLAPPSAGLPSAAGNGLPPARAAARLGGGTFLGFSLLIFCSSSALF